MPAAQRINLRHQLLLSFRVAAQQVYAEAQRIGRRLLACQSISSHGAHRLSV